VFYNSVVRSLRSVGENGLGLGEGVQDKGIEALCCMYSFGRIAAKGLHRSVHGDRVGLRTEGTHAGPAATADTAGVNIHNNNITLLVSCYYYYWLLLLLLLIIIIIMKRGTRGRASGPPHFRRRRIPFITTRGIPHSRPRV